MAASRPSPPGAEALRLAEAQSRTAYWKRWGPYLAERQWGTVREDYSAHGAAWDYLPHDHARSRAYRWGEDGLLGISDNHQRLCFALALWNGRDAILKERLFGLTGPEGNHGEDVKEYYFYLDATPTHSYMRALYKYPQHEYPYARLVEENARRGREKPEFELLDTGVFDDDRYFDVLVEYAKASPNDVLVRVTVDNRGPEAAPLTVLPTLWFRNTWAWDHDARKPRLTRGSGPGRRHGRTGGAPGALAGISSPRRGDAASPLHRERDRRSAPVRRRSARRRTEGRLPRGARPRPGRSSASGRGRDEGRGAPPAHDSGGRPGGPPVPARRWEAGGPFGPEFERVFDERQREADEFYATVIPDRLGEDARGVMRQALAGMLWSKQWYHYDVRRWLEGDPGQPPPPPERRHGRNAGWAHLYNDDVVSMPDKWEYPWYAAWDLAFHTIALALVDPDFAKDQLILLLREWYMHPNGQIPAYEWAFGDVNPPVHAWAAWRVYKIEKRIRGVADRRFLERVFQKLLLNFTWWVNRKDPGGKNVFEGGFLGLDNIGLFDRSAPLPVGGHLEQSDGTAWIGMYCLNMLAIALELAEDNPAYEDMASKFLEHFVYIAHAMNDMGGEGVELWNEEDGFYYDVLHMPDGAVVPLKVRSLVGLVPLFAVQVLEPENISGLPQFQRRMKWFLRNRADLRDHFVRERGPDGASRRLLSLVSGDRLRRVLRYMLDESEFLSPHGVRALSRFHKDHPYVLRVAGAEHRVAYEPAESTTGLFGGNSNWRGPVWLPMNFLLIEALQRFDHFYRGAFKVEFPTGSGQQMALCDVAAELSRRLTRIFLRDPEGRRPVHGEARRFQTDPRWRDLLLFYEYFHGDTGAGIGASHQTGWTGLVAKLLQQSGE